MCSLPNLRVFSTPCAFVHHAIYVLDASGGAAWSLLFPSAVYLLQTLFGKEIML